MKLFDTSAAGNSSPGPFCFGEEGPLESLCEGLAKFCLQLHWSVFSLVVGMQCGGKLVKLLGHEVLS